LGKIKRGGKEGRRGKKEKNVGQGKKGGSNNCGEVSSSSSSFLFGAAFVIRLSPFFVLPSFPPLSLCRHRVHLCLTSSVLSLSLSLFTQFFFSRPKKKTKLQK